MNRHKGELGDFRLSSPSLSCLKGNPFSLFCFYVFNGPCLDVHDNQATGLVAHTSLSSSLLPGKALSGSFLSSHGTRVRPLGIHVCHYSQSALTCAFFPSSYFYHSAQIYALRILNILWVPVRLYHFSITFSYCSSVSYQDYIPMQWTSLIIWDQFKHHFSHEFLQIPRQIHSTPLKAGNDDESQDGGFGVSLACTERTTHNLHTSCTIHALYTWKRPFPDTNLNCEMEFSAFKKLLIQCKASGGCVLCKGLAQWLGRCCQEWAHG